VLGDRVFEQLVLARVVEPTSKADSLRVIHELGVEHASLRTVFRTLKRAQDRGYRDTVAAACFEHAAAAGDVSLCLYDVTTLYFEAEQEDELRKVGYSKERRVDPQIVVGLLVDRNGFPLQVGCFEGSKAEKLTIVPIVKAFVQAHQLADMVVVADAGMLSSDNLKELDGEHLRFIVDSRMTKPRSIWRPTSGGTVTRSATGRSSTPSPHAGVVPGGRTTSWSGPNRCGTPRRIPARGGRCGRTRPSGPCGTARS
jgi:hypothetical protein